MEVKDLLDDVFVDSAAQLAAKHRKKQMETAKKAASLFLEKRTFMASEAAKKLFQRSEIKNIVRNYDAEALAASFGRLKKPIGDVVKRQKTEADKIHIAAQHEYISKVMEKKETGITLEEIMQPNVLTMDKKGKRIVRKRFNLQDGKQLFWEIIKTMIALENRGRQESKKIVFDTSDKKRMSQISEIVKWCCNDPSSKLDLSKGILIFGTQTGTGKSFIMNAVCTFFDKMSKIEGSGYDTYETVNCKILVNEIKEKKVKISRYTSPRGFNFEDLGFDEPFLDYGTKIDLMVDILNAQNSNKANGHNVRLLATSNFDPDQLGKRYEKRIFSRLVSDFNFVHADSERDYRLEPNLKHN